MATTLGKSAIATVLLTVAIAWAPVGEATAEGRCGRFAVAPATLTDHQLRTSVLCLVNLARQRHGVSPLQYSPELRRSATVHSRSMVRSGTFSHNGPGGSTLTTRIARSGYLARASSYRLAENIAAGEGRSNGAPLAIVREWMHSSGHRQNILDRGLRDFGVGIARGDPFDSGNDGATYTLDLGARG